MTVTESRPSSDQLRGLDVRKLSANIGAEVAGVDISADLDDSTVGAIRAALNAHKVLVFRGVELDDAAHQRFAGSFGPLTSAHPTVPSIEGEPNILQVDGERGVANHWHTDVTFVLSPPQLSTLRSSVVPPYGGETLIADAGAGYRALPERLRDFADTLWAVHSNSYDYVSVPLDDLDEQERAHYEVFTSIEFETVHPVVRVHPITGERGLYIGGFARLIQGLSNDESRDILRILQSYVVRPEHVLRWHWSLNELILFDNRITQHYAIDNYDRLPRKLRRVTVAGDVPVGVTGERSYSIKGDASHYSPAIESAA
jgi:alpha-ketoglutarate-dependent sulfate ester dioxygenase